MAIDELTRHITIGYNVETLQVTYEQYPLQVVDLQGSIVYYYLLLITHCL